jgi:large subunit ribosomal protein L29
MNVNELRGKNDGELQESLYDLLKEQFNLRMQKGTGQIARPDQLRTVRRNIARVKTVMSERKRVQRDDG